MSSMFPRAFTTQIVSATDKMTSAYLTWAQAVQLLAAGTLVNQFMTNKQNEVVHKEVQCVKMEVKKDIECIRVEVKKDIECVRKDVECVRKDVECVKQDVARVQRDVDRISEDVRSILKNQRRWW